jgi:hypothetical protein
MIGLPCESGGPSGQWNAASSSGLGTVNFGPLAAAAGATRQRRSHRQHRDPSLVVNHAWSLGRGCLPGPESRKVSLPCKAEVLPWYRFGTQRIVLCVQIVHGRGRIGRSGRSRTHLHRLPVGWGPKGRWFKSSRPDINGTVRSIRNRSPGRRGARSGRTSSVLCQGDAEETVAADAFVLIGARPRTDWLLPRSRVIGMASCSPEATYQRSTGSRSSASHFHSRPAWRASWL